MIELIKYVFQSIVNLLIRIMISMNLLKILSLSINLYFQFKLQICTLRQTIS